MADAGGTTGTRWVLIPVKSFAAAKRRLVDALGAEEREELARSMASHVISASAPLPVAVACDDPAVADFVRRLGARVVWTPGLGLNGAVAAGVAELNASGARFVTVVHGDLPQARGIGELEAFDGVTIAPDRHRTGTNLLRVPTALAFETHFGRDSFRLHLEEAERRSLAVRVLDREDLAFDVDEPADLIGLDVRGGGVRVDPPTS